ncbi:DUF6153 family protein [Actinopolymorpha pittospori]
MLLLVVTGVVAMHGLGPVVMADHQSGMSVPAASAHTSTMPGAFEHVRPTGGCDVPHHDGGHADHVDAMCSAAGVAGAPALPALVPIMVDGVSFQPLKAWPAGPENAGRAPPSLSELQLLRI